MWNMTVFFSVVELEVCIFCNLLRIKSLLRVDGIGLCDASLSLRSKSGVSCEGRYPRARSLRKNFS